MDERISIEEIDLLEKKQVMKEMLKERRSTEVEEWRDTVVAGSGHSDGSCWVSKLRNGGWASLGLEAPKRRVGLLVSEVGALQKDTEGDQKSLGQVMASPQKRRAVIRVESAEMQDYVSAPSLTSHLDEKMAEEDE